MRAGANLTTNRRLERLEQLAQVSQRDKFYQLARIAGREILTQEQFDDLTRWQKTVLLFPKTLSIEEWDAIAGPAQVELVALHYEGNVSSIAATRGDRK